tara:strand:+ start:1067 stop:2173 length:1107 start_codon:yes stop_codon:yes gene_type:complete
MTHLLRGLYLLALPVLSMALGSVAPAARDDAFRPSFHPDTLKGPPPGAPNDVLVLGTAHLSGLPESFKPEMAVPVVARLAAWRPTAIATEDLSGLQCDSLRRYPMRYAATVKDYCADPTAAGLATGLDVPAANAEAERLLAAWPATPAAAERRHLAAIFLAAGERASALVQWLRLPEGERHAGDGLNDALVAALEKLKSRRNETTLIAAPLAAKLGLERVWSVDDHTADSDDGAEQEAAGAAMMRAWDNPASAQRTAQDAQLHASLSAPDGLLAILRAYNAPGAAQLVYRSDFGAAFVEPSPQAFGRRYLAYWETRNLRMVANMRDVLGRKPGTRMLAIVGASHKGYYEAYLDQMHDVRLVDAMTVLK